MDQEAIKKALDNFENDKFSDAKDILTREIRSRRDEFLNDKLGLNEVKLGSFNGKKFNVDAKVSFEVEADSKAAAKKAVEKTWINPGMTNVVDIKPMKSKASDGKTETFNVNAEVSFDGIKADSEDAAKKAAEKALKNIKSKSIKNAEMKNMNVQEI